jgi:hypothetical protein
MFLIAPKINAERPRKRLRAKRFGVHKNGGLVYPYEDCEGESIADVRKIRDFWGKRSSWLLTGRPDELS